MSISLTGLECLCFDSHLKFIDISLSISDMLFSFDKVISELLIENIKSVDFLHENDSLKCFLSIF